MRSISQCTSLYLWMLALVILSFVFGISDGNSNATTIDIRMPSANPSQDNEYLCTYVKLPSNDQYIVEFEPKGNVHNAHHMLLFGCDKPASWRSVWNCGHVGTCENTENILFAWANGAAAKTLPQDVGFQIGKSSGIRYLVLQVHYKYKNTNLQDDSGFLLHLTPQRQPYLAGIFLMWAGEVDIPPESKGIHSDIVCKYDEKTTIYAFAFRTHAHGLGRVVSGYKVNHNNWTLLGKMDPKLPQAFYPMKGIHKISKGDTLAARCTYDSSGHHLKEHTHIGPTGDDEMCNFYIMYYRDANQPDVDYAACDDDLAHHSSLEFPTDADTPLKTPTHKMATDKNSKSTENIKKTTNRISSKPSRHQTETSHKTSKHKVHKKPSVPPPQQKHISSSNHEYKLVQSWPNLGKERLGQVSGVAVDSKGNVIIFHRGKRTWDYNSFDDQNVFLEDTPIRESTVLTIDPNTGKVLHRWGKNMFYMPHGITVDHHDNIWLTDVATHQVYKFPPHGGGKALLTIGEKFEPDNDEKHFCKPTDVAVERKGSFYVADGYCNSRVVKYNADGEFVDEWGTYGSKKGEFIIPHSLSLDESKHHLYVADRQNGRIQVISTRSGSFLPIIKKQQFGEVFALDFNTHSGLLHVINGNTDDNNKPVKGFTLHGNNLIETWPTNKQHFRHPHDVISSADNVDLYVAEIGPNRIWKLTKRRTTNQKTLVKNYPAICLLDMEIGPCRAAMPRWYFNAKETSCKRFIFGGCSGNDNNFKSKRECEAKCGHLETGHRSDSDSGRTSEMVLKGLESRKDSSNDGVTPVVHNGSIVKPTLEMVDDWRNASGEDEGIESNIYAASHNNKSANHTGSRDINDQSEDSDQVVGDMIPALIILSVLAVPIVFLLIISIALRLRAYRRDSRYKQNRLLKTDKDGLAVGRTRGWLSYLNCCDRQSYRFDKVNLAEFYSDSESDGV